MLKCLPLLWVQRRLVMLFSGSSATAPIVFREAGAHRQVSHSHTRAANVQNLRVLQSSANCQSLQSRGKGPSAGLLPLEMYGSSCELLGEGRAAPRIFRSRLPMRSLDPTPLRVSRQDMDGLDWLSTATLKHKGGPRARGTEGTHSSTLIAAPFSPRVTDGKN